MGRPVQGTDPAPVAAKPAAIVSLRIDPAPVADKVLVQTTENDTLGHDFCHDELVSAQCDKKKHEDPTPARRKVRNLAALCT